MRSLYKDKKAEGIKVKDDQIQQFDQVFWDPIKELGL